MSDRIPMIPPFRVVSRVQILSETKDYNHEMRTSRLCGGIPRGHSRMVRAYPW